jgi:hypothetical protein
MRTPALRPTSPRIVRMSFRLAIPWRLLSSMARFRFTPGTVCCNVVLPVEIFSSNGQLFLNCLCQPRGNGKHLAIGAKVLFILAGLLGLIWGLDIFAIRHNSLGIVTIYRVWSRA